jgi:hypothetical protein
MKKVIIIVLTALLNVYPTGCNTSSKKKSNSDTAAISQSTTPQPQVKWEVRKETDDKGNLVRYDSTYVSIYAERNGKPLPINMDSITTNFRRSMKIWSPSVFNTDSLLYWDLVRMDSILRKWDDRYTSL